MGSIFNFLNGLLYFKGSLFILNLVYLRQSVLKELHNSTLGGHFDFKPTIAHIAASFNCLAFIMMCIPLSNSAQCSRRANTFLQKKNMVCYILFLL